MGRATDASCVKETTVNWPSFPLSFALCYFLALFLMPTTQGCSKTHLYSYLDASTEKGGLRQRTWAGADAVK